ncbi:hypothetical protein [Taibaiella helva]|uniref:hypothetical protein n=1 Tax=Taibaiella helva TaxID=2301235 RepID=UPI000E592BEE|nr:hypothetical protein [Taibaiella helva]
MKNTIAIVLACLSLNCAAQSGDIYSDHFDDNRSGWLSDDTTENTGLKIEGGNLIMDGTKGKHATSITKQIDNSQDFEIEITYTVLKQPGKYDNAGRLFWGFSDSLGGTWVGLSTKLFSFTYCRGGDHKNDKHKSVFAYPRLKLDTPIHLSIRKVADEYLIFINGKRQRRLRFEKLPGDELAIEVAKDSALKIDDISIKYLN